MSDPEQDKQATEVTGSGMSELEMLRKCLENQEKALEKQNTLAEQNSEAIRLLSQAMRGMVPADQPAEIREAKFEKLYLLWLKPSKLKEFKQADHIEVSDWLLQFHTTVNSLASSACKLNLQNEPLTPQEFSKLLRHKLSFSADKEISQALGSINKTWDTATVEEITKTMKRLYHKREPKVCSLLKLFSADKVKRNKEESCNNFFGRWKESLAPSLVCNKNEDFKNYYDLSMTAAYYLAVNCPDIQKDLSKIPEEEQSLQKYFEESCASQSRSMHFKDTQERSHALDNSTTPNVAKSDTKSSRGRGRGRGRGGNEFHKDNSSAQSTDTPPGKSQQNHPPKKQMSAPQTDSKSKNSESGARPKKKTRCTYCNKWSHQVSDCRVRLQDQSDPTTSSAESSPAQNNSSNYFMRKLEIIEKNTDVSVTTPKCDVVPSVEDSTCAIPQESSYDDLDAQVLSVKSLQTGPPLPVIKASFIIEGRYICDFEIDTDASHTMISPTVFKKAQYVAKEKPTLGPEQTMRLADGSFSNHKCRLTHLSLARADNPKDEATFPVMVVDGPNIILGRSAIRYFWPNIYDKLATAAASTREAANLIPASPPEILDKLCGISSVSTGVDSLSTSENSCSTATTSSSSEKQIPILPAVQTISPSGDHTSSSSDSDPEVTQESGEKHCLDICKQFPELFDGKLGLFKGVEARIHLKEGHEKYLKPRPAAKVPHGIKDKYKKELDKMMLTHEKVDGRGLKVATQLVPVVKGDKVRLCGNYKSTLNEHIEDEPYNFPTCNEQMDKLKGDMYSVLDMSGAFNQFVLHPETATLLTVVTPEGYARPTRLPFGIKTAPKIFQSNMDKLLHGMDGKGPVPSTACIVDDICITGATPAEHFSNLTELLSRLHSAGLKLNPEKCKFYQKEVKFLGKIIDKNGQRIDSESVAAIVNMPQPTDKQSLRSFLGHMSYIGKHISDLRTARAPLDSLLKVDAKFEWTDAHTKAFESCKKMASSAATLAHYDDKLPLVLTTDASPVGLGACLSHKITENGKSILRPIYYASCSLKPSEKNYAQVDREGLAVYWAIKYF